MKTNFRKQIWTSFALLSSSIALLSAEQAGLFKYTLNEGKVTISDYPEDAVGDVVIPAKIDDKPVTAIANDAFSGCVGLTSITIPKGVTAIGASAFYDCSNVTSITIPNSVATIEFSSFSDCSSLTSVTFPKSVTSIGWYAFSGCSGLTSVTIPEGVTTIGFSAFSGCSSLTSVAIPKSVTTIDWLAFEGCAKLKTAVFSGDAPAEFDKIVFSEASAELTIHYVGSSKGFTSPTWKGFSTKEMNQR
ncbi:MAG: leucine-rich repeat domain-containing protein [Verrucomicrobiales bacterium]|nr:leucine-rich repeat domain-containing protein [Verrucomicrobiales bacterium]